MDIRIFKKDEDFKILREMANKRDLKHLDSEEIPVLGVLVSQKRVVVKVATAQSETKDMPVAIGFLRQCEGFYAIMDSVITNPDATREERHEALQMVFEELINLAKGMGVFRIIGFSVDQGIMERSKTFGFKEINQTVLGLDIKG